MVSDFNLTELQADIDGIVKPCTDPNKIRNEFRKVAEKELYETPEILAENIKELKALVKGKIKHFVTLKESKNSCF